MNPKRTIQTSKFLSMVLRHQPERIGIRPDSAGWVPVEELLTAMGRHGHPLLLRELRELVTSSDKQRFALSEDGLRIRANQGHSIEVDLGYEPATPPAALYHGTIEKFLAPIRKMGLIRGQRHHVHLSADILTARKVGERRGHPVVLKIQAGRMHEDGLPFFISANGVWLTEHVPPQYIEPTVES